MQETQAVTAGLRRGPGQFARSPAVRLRPPLSPSGREAHSTSSPLRAHLRSPRKVAFSFVFNVDSALSGGPRSTTKRAFNCH